MARIAFFIAGILLFSSVGGAAASTPIMPKPVKKAVPVSTVAELSPDTIFKRYKAAVVRIEVSLHGASLGVGSGFFLKSNGEIATSLHVIRAFLAHPETEIAVKLADGNIVKNVKIGACGDARGIDLCLLKIEITPKAVLPAAAVEVTPGESIVAIGHPRGLDFSISKGIVSAVRKHPSGWSEVQIDAAISPGNSGGPIINHLGQAIGVVYQFERDGQNLNFGILTPEIDQLKDLGLPFLSIADARKDFLARSKQRSRVVIDRSTKPAIQSVADGKPRPAGLKWMRSQLGLSSFMMLLPDFFQTCDRSDDGETNATTCSSVGGDIVVTVQKRPRSLQGSLLGYRGRKLVEPRLLAIVDRLESEGVWEDGRQNRAAFLSRPSVARCSAVQKRVVVSSDETSQLNLRKKTFFQGATSVCRFETENDSDPGAVSASQWIEVGNEFYGINVWSADPGRLPLLQSLGDLLLASAGTSSDETRLAYRVHLRPSVKRETDSSVPSVNRTIAGADISDLYGDETSTITIARTRAVVPSMMDKRFLRWASSIAKTASLKIYAGGGEISTSDVGGSAARSATWVIPNPSDRQKSAIMMMTARFTPTESWVIYEIQPLPSLAQFNRVPSKELSSDIERFHAWTDEFQPY